MSEIKNIVPGTNDTSQAKFQAGNEASPEREEGRRPDERSGEASANIPPQRLLAKHKSEAVVMLLSGESIDIVARKYGVPVSAVSEWRNTFLMAGQNALKTGKKEDIKDIEIKHLKETIGDLTMDLQIAKAAIEVAKKRSPFVFRKQKK